MKEKLNEALESVKKAIVPPHDEANGAVEREERAGIPAVPTPDQTRTDGMIADPGLAHADTAGLVEDRKREGNLEGM